MNDLPLRAYDDPGRLVNQFLAQYDAPAYVRRARAVQDAFDALLGRCRLRRDELLKMVRIELGTLHALADGWHNLLPSLVDADQIEVLERLHAELRPRLRVPVSRTSSASRLRRSLRTLAEAIGRFNRRWAEFVSGLDLGKINELRDGYNRYYLLEKECAVRSPRLARQGFHPLKPLTTDDVLALLPPLPVPRLKS